MKKNLKKLGAVIIAMAMCLSLCCTAFAASSPTTLGRITINGEAGETYSIYRIFDLTYEEGEEEWDPNASYSYAVTEEWANVITSEFTFTVGDDEYTPFTIDENGYLSLDSDIYDYVDDGEVMAALARALLDAAEYYGIQATNTAEAGTDGVVEFENLYLGWYLVDTSLGTLCMLTSTDPNAEIEEKNDVPDLTKYVDHQAVETSENNYEVEYEIDIDHITGVSNLVLHDTMDSELQLEDDSFVVTLIDGATITTLTANEDYVINSNPGHTYEGRSCSFDIVFSVDGNDYDFSGCSENAYIEVTYKCMVETDGDEYEFDVDYVDNFAMITYGNNGESEWKRAEVELFGFEIFKYTDAENEGYDIIIVDAYNDSAEGQTDRLYLALVDDNAVTYYAVFSAIDDVENEYEITDWIEASRVYAIQENPFEILGYINDAGVEVQLSYVTEPDASYTEDNPLTLLFYYDNNSESGVEPAHSYIVLDEFGTYSSEVDQGEEWIYGRVSNALAGAEFTLTNESGQTAYFRVEEDLGIYLFEGWNLTDEQVEEGGFTATLVSDESGYVRVEGLNYGTYTLTETKAPDGYNKLASSITVIIDEDGYVYVYENGSETAISDKVIDVLNSYGQILPGTGGIGTTIFYIIGGLLVVGAVVVLVTRRRMTNES